MESKKDAFRKYLEGAGVIDAITKGKRGSPGDTNAAMFTRFPQLSPSHAAF